MEVKLYYPLWGGSPIFNHVPSALTDSLSTTVSVTPMIYLPLSLSLVIILSSVSQLCNTVVSV